VLIGGLPVARLGDMAVCVEPLESIVMGGALLVAKRGRTESCVSFTYFLAL
jgi:uncharacterized Zn-binding protein involved in type VI secretion